MKTKFYFLFSLYCLLDFFYVPLYAQSHGQQEEQGKKSSQQPASFLQQDLLQHGLADHQVLDTSHELSNIGPYLNQELFLNPSEDLRSNRDEDYDEDYDENCEEDWDIELAQDLSIDQSIASEKKQDPPKNVENKRALDTDEDLVSLYIQEIARESEEKTQTSDKDVLAEEKFSQELLFFVKNYKNFPSLFKIFIDKTLSAEEKAETIRQTSPIFHYFPYPLEDVLHYFSLQREELCKISFWENQTNSSLILINGINKKLSRWQKDLTIFQNSFKDLFAAPVVGLYSPCSNGFIDFCTATIEKLHYETDFIENLVAYLKKQAQIHINKKNKQKAFIICHSRGAIEVDLAMSQLSKLEKKQFIILAIAPASLIYNSQAFLVINFISSHDKIPRFTSPYRYVLGQVFKNKYLCIKRVKNISMGLDIGNALLHHAFLGPSHFRAIIHALKWLYPIYGIPKDGSLNP